MRKLHTEWLLVAAALLIQPSPVSGTTAKLNPNRPDA